MQDFIPIWKTLVSSRKATFRHFIQRAILIAMRKEVDFDTKVQIAQNIIERGLTPITNHTKLANGCQPFQALNNVGSIDPKYTKLLGQENFLSEEETKEFLLIWQEINPKRFGVHYSYIFLYGNLMPEQRCIQMAHAAMKLGQELTQKNAWPAGVSAENLHYTMVPGTMRNYISQDVLKLNGTPHVKFYDYDYSFDAEGKLVESQYQSLKAIMTYPIHHSKRASLKDYELYRFESYGSN